MSFPQDDLQMIVSNIGVNADLSAIYTSNSAQHTAFVQVSLNPEHKQSTFTYMDRVRAKLASDLPELSTYFQTGGLVDSVVNAGMPAPIDIQVSGNNQHAAYDVAARWRESRAQPARCQRRADPAGPRLSGNRTQRPPRDGGAPRSHGQRRGAQRDHGLDFERHDRARILGRSAQRQQLLPHRAVHQSADWRDDDGGLQADSAATPRTTTTPPCWRTWPTSR